MSKRWIICGVVWSLLCVAVEVYMARLEGLAHLLWFSHLGMIASAVLWWWPQRVAVSTLAVAVLLPELVWTLDFTLGLPFGGSLSGATAYMWNERIPQTFRLVSLFHIPLPAVIWLLLRRSGYDWRGLPGAVAVSLVVLPASWVLSTDWTNINWTHNFDEAGAGLPSPWQLALVMVALPVAVYLPSHLGFSLIERRWPVATRGAGGSNHQPTHDAD
ncbi:MAG: hypothetical protein PF961_19170 [Planctomycetota bacterium]|nr:hypothetical protein [Planctomycetota bacterium]